MNHTRRINAVQRERLLDLVEENRNFLFGDKTQGNFVKNQIWQDIASVLNKLGSEKTVDQWRKTWTDIKSTVKKKAIELKAINAIYGSDFPKDMQLSEEDYQVLRMCDVHVMDGIPETIGAPSNMRNINPAQRKSMLELIGKNVSVLCGPITKEKMEKWSMIASSLNTLGPKKSSEQWRKVWVDMKKGVKRKLANSSTCDSSEKINNPDLTEEDLRVIQIYEAEGIDYPQEIEESSEATLDEGISTVDSMSSAHSSHETIQQHIEMENVKWSNHTDNIIEFQKSLMNDIPTCDVTLAFKGKSVKVHRFILSACSTFLRELLKDVPIAQEARIVLPEVEGSLLDSVLNFLYMGETNISSTNLTGFLEAIENLGIKSPISFECGNTNITSKEQEEPTEIELQDELKQEIIDVDDGDIEEFNIVDQEILRQPILINDSNDDESITLNENEYLQTEPCRCLTPTEDVTPRHCGEHFLDMNNPMTVQFVDHPIEEYERNSKRARIKRESSDDDSLDEMSEPQTFRDKVNRLRLEQKKSLKKAFLAHLDGGISLQKAATTHNVSSTPLFVQVAHHSKDHHTTVKEK